MKADLMNKKKEQKKQNKEKRKTKSFSFMLFFVKLYKMRKNFSSHSHKPSHIKHTKAVRNKPAIEI
jgi:hypothetical protein